MFEQLVSDILTRVLGKYVKGLNRDNFNIGIWGGDVTLQNLLVKDDVLDELDVPFRLKAGVLGKLRIKIPWNSLYKQPFELYISGVSIILKPRGISGYDKDREKRAANLKKQAEVRRVERMKQAARTAEKAKKEMPSVEKPAEASSKGTGKIGKEETEDEESTGWFSTQLSAVGSQLAAKIVNSIQVFVEDIHIRIEDDRDPNHPSALGVTLEGIAIQSADRNFQPGYADSTDPFIYKLATLSSLMVYWNAFDYPLSYTTDADMVQLMHSLIWKEGQHPPHQKLVKPVNGSLKITHRKSSVGDTPRISIECLLEKLSVSFTDAQFCHGVDLADWLIRFPLRQQNLKWRPTVDIHENPRAWWKFAIDSTLARIRDRRRRLTSQFLLERRRTRKEYVKLYTNRLKTQQADLPQRLVEMEEELSAEDILLYRSIAEAIVAPQLKKQEDSREPWYLDWLYKSEGTTVESDPQNEETVKITPEMREAFYRIIAYDEAEDAAPTPSHGSGSGKAKSSHKKGDGVLLSFSFVLEKTTFELSKQEEETEVYSPLLRMNCTHLAVGAFVRESLDSALLDISVGELVIYDKLTLDSVMPRILTAQPRVNHTAFLLCSVEYNPDDSPALVAVQLRTEPLDIVVNKRFMMEMGDIFGKPFKTKIPAVGEDPSKKKVPKPSEVSFQMAKDIINTKVAVDVDVDIRAPRLILTDNTRGDGESHRLTIDLAHVFIRKRATEMESVTEESNWRDQLYEQLELRIKEVQMIVSTREEDEDEDLIAMEKDIKKRYICDKFDIEIALGILLTEPTKELSKIRVHGLLPEMNFYFAHQKVRELLRVVTHYVLDLGPMEPWPIVDDLSEEEQKELERRTAEEAAVEPVSYESKSKTAHLMRSPPPGDARLVPEPIDGAGLQAYFSVRVVTLYLFYEKDDRWLDLISVRLDGLVLQMVNRPVDMWVFIGLHGVVVEDEMQEDGNAFRYIGTSYQELANCDTKGGSRSDDSSGGQNTIKTVVAGRVGVTTGEFQGLEVGDDLISACYTVMERESPDYRALDHNVDVNLNTIYVMINRLTLVALIDWLWQAFIDDSDRRMDVKMKRMEAYRREHNIEKKEFPPEKAHLGKWTPPYDIFFRVTVSIQHVDITLNRLGKKFLFADLNKIIFAFQMTDAKMEVKGSLGNVLVRDMSGLSPDWQDLLALHGSESVEFAVNVYDERYGNFPGHKFIVRVRVNSVYLAFLQRFWYDVWDYYWELYTMQELYLWISRVKAKNRHELAAKSKEFVEAERAEGLNDLIKYEIVLKNIRFELPRYFTNPEYLLSDIGAVTITNVFLKAKPDDAFQGVTELLSIALDGASLYSGNKLLGEDAQPIVEEVDLNIEFERPLDDQDYLAPVEMKLSLDCKEIEVTSTEAQWVLFMNTLNANIDQYFIRKDEWIARPRPAYVNAKIVTPDSPDVENPEHYEVNLTRRPGPGPCPTDRVWITFSSTFHFHQISWEFLEEDPADPERMISQTFHNFKELAIVNVNSSDDYLKFDLTVQATDWTDTKPNNENLFKNLLGQGSEARPKHQFHMVWTSGPEPPFANKKKLAFTFENPRMMWVPNTWGKFYDFLMRPWNQPTPPPERPVVPPTEDMKKAVQAARIAAQVKKQRQLQQESSGGDEEQRIGFLAPVIYQPDFELSLLVNNAEVVFPGDVKADPCLGIVLTTTLMLNFTMLGDDGDLQLLLENMEVISCVVKTRPPVLSRAVKIVQPMDFTLRRWANEKKCDMRWCLDQVVATFTYEDVRAIMNVVNTFNTPPVEEKPKEAPPPIPEIRQEQNMKMVWGGLRITIINDIFGFNTPLAYIRFYRMSMDWRDWTFNSELNLRLTLDADAYNIRIAMWEPIIEPWKCLIKLTSTLPDEEGHSTSCTSIEADQMLDFNCSKTFISTLQKMQEAWKKQEGQGIPEIRNMALAYEPVVLRNETGQRFRYWVPGDSFPHTLEHGEERSVQLESLTFLPDREDVATSTSQGDHTVSIELPGGWDRIWHLPVNRVGSWVVPLSPTPSNVQVKALFSVQFRAGESSATKVATLQSNVEIVNTCNEPISVLLDVPRRLNCQLPSIKPEGSAAIPLQFSTSGIIRIRPLRADRDLEYGQTETEEDASAYQWSDSDRPIHCSKLENYNAVLCCQHNHNTEKFSDTYFLVHVEEGSASKVKKIGEKTGRYTITVAPPIVLENLLACTLQYNVLDKKTGTKIMKGSIRRGERREILEVVDEKNIEVTFCIDGMRWSRRYSLNDQASGIIAMGPQSSFFNNNITNIRLVDSQGRDLILHMEAEYNHHGTLNIAIFCKYWMINKTGLRLLYQQASKVQQDKNMAAGQESLEAMDMCLPDDPATWYKDTSPFRAPFMFSYSTFDLFGNRCSVKIANSRWSKSFSVESVGTEGHLRILDEERKAGGEESGVMSFHLGITIELCPGKYNRTKRITFYPRYVVVNRTDRKLYYRQVETKQGYLLRPGQRLPFHWPDKDKPSEMCITLSPNHTWSAAFVIDELAEFAVKIMDKNDGSTYLARVDVVLKKATFFVVFKPEAKDIPPYRIENLTREPILYHQKMWGKPTDLGPCESVPYTWDQPGQTHKLVVELPQCRFKKEYNLDKIKMYPIEILQTDPITGSDELWLSPGVFADGPTRVFRISDAHMASDETRNAANEDKPADSQYILRLAGVGFSIIDDRPSEIAYITFQNLFLDYNETKDFQKVEWKTGSFQIDNQNLTTLYPVFLARKGEGDIEDVFRLSVVKNKQYQSVAYYNYFAVLIQELDVKSDDNFINQIILFADLNPISDAEPDHYESDELIDEPADSKKLYFEFLHINPIKVNLTFSLCAEGETRTDNPVRATLGAIGVAVANVDDAPISLNTLVLKHAFKTQSELMSRVAKHYQNQVISELYKVVGSFDFLGNPVSLVRNLGTGVHDFFYEPAHGLISSPADFVSGMQAGGKSLVKNTVVGLFNTASKITGTVGKGIAYLSLDRDFVRERELRNRSRPKHVGDGLTLGAKDFGTGLLRGLTGVVTSPVEGAKKDGFGGLLKGAGKGVIGVAVKPGVGIFDMLTRTTQGIRNTATFYDKKTARVRAPRAFGPDKRLTVYSFSKSIGQSLLWSINEGKHVGEWHLFHCTTRDDRFVLVSDKTLFYINIKERDVVWDTSLSEITQIQQDGNSVVIYESRPQSALKSLFSKDKAEVIHKISFSNREQTDWFFDHFEWTINTIRSTERQSGSFRSFPTS